MPDLLIELFSEEIPARMQGRAAEDLRGLVTEGLKEAGLEPGASQAHAGPRRLVLSVEGLAERTPDVTEERKGPRVDAPDAAIQGFLKSAGVSLDQCAVQEDKKGKVYIAHISRPGRPTSEVVKTLAPEVVRRFPWPKSMRWGRKQLRWVRPLHSIVCLFDGKVADFDIEGIRSGRLTRGHRFMAREEIRVESFPQYVEALKAAKVIVSADERAAVIRERAGALATEAGLKPVEDEALIRETAGLAEWPVVLMGTFDKAFLELPPEVIATSLKAHQKCFVLTDASGGLSNRYLLVANLVAKDGGGKIVAGNDRVIAARLSDARFFWDQDRKTKLEDLVPKLRDITFHAKLGTQFERVERIEALAGEIARIIGADVEKAKLAARLAKADLVTGMVGEFPELQGLMGGYYARAEGLDQEVADAIRDHYKPQGPSDSVPRSKVAQAVALADKLDTLVGFWAIDEKPTGSKDPYALRRAALGVIRIIQEGGLRLGLGSFGDHGHSDLLSFFADRLKIYLREQGARHDLIDAVFSLGGQDDLLMIVRRVEALGKFLDTDDGKNLLVGVKRASNILRIEEKKDGRRYDGLPDKNLLVQGDEKALALAIDRAEALARKAVEAEDFEAAMSAIARLRAPVDAFFDTVTVNADDPSFRENRLKLLNRIRAATLAVADFSKIEG